MGRLATVVLTAAGTIALVALVYCLYGHGWSREQLAIATPLIVSLAGLAAAFFASLRLRPALKITVAVLCVSLTAVMYSAELVLRLGAPSTPYWPNNNLSEEGKYRLGRIARGFGVEFDTRARLDVLTDLRKRHKDAVPAVMIHELMDQSEKELLPLGGVSSSLTVLCNETGQYVTYESDQHGFRNPQEVWNSAHADLAAVGQSPVQGYCVANGKGFVDRLRTRKPLTLNLGVSGESALLQLAAIKEYLPRYEPKVVLWFFSEGLDIADAYDASTQPLPMRYLEPTFSQHLLTRQPEIDKRLRRLVADSEMLERAKPVAHSSASLLNTAPGFLKLWSLREKAALVYGIKAYEDNSVPYAGVAQDFDVHPALVEQAAYDLLSATLRQAQSATSRWGGTLYVVYLPSWTRYRNGPRVPERERIKVLGLVRALGIPAIDVQPAFQAQSDPLSLFPFRRYGHYNERGNEVVADTVLAFLSAHERKH